MTSRTLNGLSRMPRTKKLCSDCASSTPQAVALTATGPSSFKDTIKALKMCCSNNSCAARVLVVKHANRAHVLLTGKFQRHTSIKAIVGRLNHLGVFSETLICHGIGHHRGFVCQHGMPAKESFRDAPPLPTPICALNQIRSMSTKELDASGI